MAHSSASSSAHAPAQSASAAPAACAGRERRTAWPSWQRRRKQRSAAARRSAASARRACQSIRLSSPAPALPRSSCGRARGQGYVFEGAFAGIGTPGLAPGRTRHRRSAGVCKQKQAAFLPSLPCHSLPSLLLCACWDSPSLRVASSSASPESRGAAERAKPSTCRMAHGPQAICGILCAPRPRRQLLHAGAALAGPRAGLG